MATMEQSAQAIKDLAADIQERNNQMKDISHAMRLAKSLAALFDSKASGDTAIPPGPELDAFRAAASALGLNVDDIDTNSKLAATIQNLQIDFDSISSPQHEQMLRLQSITGNHSETVILCSNLMKSTHERHMSIVNNMRS